MSFSKRFILVTVWVKIPHTLFSMLSGFRLKENYKYLQALHSLQDWS
uniref:Uncharacterized protein n=1 Tax=Anguilla anguilla TaxID=7936 RepID=A0A0E9WB79_ANGAN